MTDRCLSPLQFETGFRYHDEEILFMNDYERFVKNIQFSPDGRQLLEVSEGSQARVCDVDDNLIQDHLYYKVDGGISLMKEEDSFEISKNTSDSIIRDPIKESTKKSHHNSLLKLVSVSDTGDSIFDAKWYPLMSSSDPSSCCFVTSTRDHPIHLWDSSSGRIRCSYLGYDHYDELDSAYSLTFNLEGDKLYTGTNRIIRFEMLMLSMPQVFINPCLIMLFI